MDIRQGGAFAVALLLALLLATLATWAACRWWYGKKLALAAHRLQKSEKERQFSQQQTAQARQQIGQLKSELESHQQSTAEQQAARRRTSQAEDALLRADREPVVDVGMLPIVSAHGFADTQLLPE